MNKKEWRKHRCPECHDYTDGIHTCKQRWVDADACRKYQEEAHIAGAEQEMEIARDDVIQALKDNSPDHNMDVQAGYSHAYEVVVNILS